MYVVYVVWLPLIARFSIVSLVRYSNKGRRTVLPSEYYAVVSFEHYRRAVL